MQELSEKAATRLTFNRTRGVSISIAAMCLAAIFSPAQADLVFAGVNAMTDIQALPSPSEDGDRQVPRTIVIAENLDLPDASDMIRTLQRELDQVRRELEEERLRLRQVHPEEQVELETTKTEQGGKQDFLQDYQRLQYLRQFYGQQQYVRQKYQRQEFQVQQYAPQQYKRQ